MSFDLPEFMFSHFNRMDFGGDLFEQWPVRIRFEIGIKQIDRKCPPSTPSTVLL